MTAFPNFFCNWSKQSSYILKISVLQYGQSIVGHKPCAKPMASATLTGYIHGTILLLGL